ncbi:MFS transporter [Labrys sp. LIt4]|uniref:MFS transporter n=1 Tax=Labrys sp. LIt4 TaxID=2821355 RepID=UPI001ADFED0A|nr:MFS transporter [Labrys sp. LIt4]
MIERRTVLCLGLFQFVAWGATYYLVGGFGERMAVELGWSRDIVYGGFAVALLVMGLVSPLCGRLIDRHGGRGMMASGSVLAASGCVGLAVSHSLPVYFAAWLVLGVAMRLTLYDAAFAALARAGGAEARRAMAQITLPGGLSSTAFWPLGTTLADSLGWRGAVLVYAGLMLATVPLALALPAVRRREKPAPGAERSGPRPGSTGSGLLLAGVLYVLITTILNFLNAGMSSHMIAILAGLGLAQATAVWVATLRGIGQSGARLAEILFGTRLHPLALNLLACSLLPLSFAAGFAGGYSLTAAMLFALGYGAGNGLATITRGTVPLVLFDHRAYGAITGRLLAPSFMVSAGAPVIYARVIGWWGQEGALALSLALAGVTLAAALLLKLRFAPASAGSCGISQGKGRAR